MSSLITPVPLLFHPLLFLLCRSGREEGKVCSILSEVAGAVEVTLAWF